MALLENLGKFKDLGLLIIRIGIGLSFSLIHGLPKIMGGVPMWTKMGGAMGSVGIHFLPAFWGFMASGSEAIGGLLVLVGLFFRPACIFLVLTMVVASVVTYTQGDGFSDASHAIELGVVFLGLLLIGPGKYSIDRK
jgi:putative oxidoreductase